MKRDIIISKKILISIISNDHEFENFVRTA